MATISYHYTSPLTLSYAVCIEKYNSPYDMDEVIESWIEEHKQLMNETPYILSDDISKTEYRHEIVEKLEAEGWCYRSALFNKLRKRGYKLSNS